MRTICAADAHVVRKFLSVLKLGVEILMGNKRSDIQWASRVPRHKIQRLYEADAKGILDEDLLNDVGITLLLRCESILAVAEAQHGRVKCPRCTGRERTVIIKHPYHKGDIRDCKLKCPECGWEITWGEYALSFKRKQLNAGGAVEAFKAFIREYTAARTSKEKLLVIDRLIHEFHYSLRRQPELPTRPVGVNLIEGNLMDVVQFLDSLSYGEEMTSELRDNRVCWRGKMRETHWGEVVGADEEVGR
jgi:hypothetical protein